MKHIIRPVALNQVHINDSFWSPVLERVRETVIPFQWEALNDRVPGAEPSHAIENIRIAAGQSNGEFVGLVFQDSDVAKWIEAVGYSLHTHPDPALEAIADDLIGLIEKAQQPDGYLNTWYTLKEPGKRWTNLLECHELYCAGHMMEAAVAYFEGTGKRRLLDVMCRFADHIDTVFGPEPEKLHGYDGHEEVEIGLIKLFHATGNEKYLGLSQYMINARGEQPYFFLEDWERHGRISHWEQKRQMKEPDLAYNQAHQPVREQEVAIGHAVRAVYLYSGMADIALETGDDTLRAACERLFRNIAHRQLYITGGIGQTVHGEAFSFDYDLPNDTVYQETCASIGLVFMAQRMLRFGPDRLYADVLEQALYNSVISGMSEDGKHFFYVNPLEVNPEASSKDPGKKHIPPVRPQWYGCACCPPNLARLMTSLGEYVYSTSREDIHVHLFVGGSVEMETAGGTVRVVQENGYPWKGDIQLRLEAVEGKSFPIDAFTLFVRVPGWTRKAELAVCGEKREISPLLEKGYLRLERNWQSGDTVALSLEMTPTLVKAHPKVRADAGKVALRRGPLVYCFEEKDNGTNLQALSIQLGTSFTEHFDATLSGGVMAVTLDGSRLEETGWAEDELYQMLPDRGPAFKTEQVKLKAIPYYAWSNRGEGEMTVWMRLDP